MTLDLAPYQSLPLALGGEGLYLTGEDNWRLTTWGALAGAVVALEGRYLTDAGVSIAFAERHVPNSDRSAATSIFPCREGRVTNVHLRASTGTALVGHIGALLEVIRGREGGVQPLGALLQGYITSASRLAWPGGPLRPLMEGPGRIRVIVGTDPAANVEIVETVPTGARWRLRTFAYTLVTDGNVATRTPILTIDDGANIYWETGSNVAQTATQTAVYRAGVGSQFLLFNALSYNLILPGDLVLAAGHRIRTVTGNRQAGDNYGAPVYSVEEWIEQ